MRKPILFLLLPFPATACTDAPAEPDLAVIPAFAEAARPLACDRLDLDGAAPREIRQASDSTWTLLDAAAGVVLIVDDRGNVLRTVPLPAAGPGAVGEPVSAVALGDTAVAVASRIGLRLVQLRLDGTVTRSDRLDFVPHSLAATPTGVVVAPLAFGDRPPSLLARVERGVVTPIPIARRPYADMMVGALGNAVLVERLPDGALLAVHQYLRPRAFRIGAGPAEPLAFPIPDGTRAQVGYVPRPPITEDQLGRMLTPALALSVDPVRGEVYVLTRSGRTLPGGARERAILRLTGELRFLEGYTLGVRAGGMVYLPRRHAVVVHDEMDRVLRCALPAPASG